MNSARIYEEKINIDTGNVKDFYNKRAKKIFQMDNPYSVVFNADQNPNQTATRNAFDKEHIFPLLKINSDSRVLDIGCGIGRFAEFIIPISSYYFGADFSEEMIRIAKNNCYFENKDYEFHAMSFQELISKPEDFFKYKFTSVILLGVCEYINDIELKKCFERLVELLDERCTLYFGEPVGINTRLTLNDFYSENLNENYSAIYRTPSEYNELYDVFYKNNFKIIEQDFMPADVNGTRYSDTDRWYTVMER